MSNIEITKNEETLLKEKFDKSIRKVSEESNNSLQTKDTIVEKEKIKQKKHVTFIKPVYTIIDVESYKKYNEDISETRFYYISENKPDNNDHVRANCTCSVF
jgi:hypothetical protein